MIEVKNLVKKYGDHTAVDHLSFHVDKGQIYGFLGPNGAGKSTTMNIMTGYIASTSGEVLIDGHNILEEPEIPSKFYCGYGTSMIYVQTNGKCYACCDNVATNSHYIGDIYSGITFSNHSINNTICKNCTYLKLCGGRCGRMHKDFTTERVKQYCELNIYMFNLILENIDKIKEIISKYPEFYNKIMDTMISYTEYTA